MCCRIRDGIIRDGKPLSGFRWKRDVTGSDYPESARINLTGIQVSVDSGYEFIGWRDSSFNELTTVLMNDHKTIYAEFNPVADIPTLNEWGMIILAFLMACAAFIRQQHTRRQSG